MCTPTRAALLTGLYQHRFGREFESALAGHVGSTNGLPLEAFTLAEALKELGYATGMFGKWHLGFALPLSPTRQGFGEFRGLLSGDGDHHSHVDRSGFEDWWHNEKIEMESGYTADLITRHSIDFIERHKDRPFFLYVPHLLIHFPWQGPEDPPHRVKGTDYTNDKWGIIPDRSNVSPHVKSMVEALDRSTGAIIAALKRLNLDRKTFVLFCSDNGGYIRYAGGFERISSNGPLRGQKTDVFEGGHRVPAIAWWPGRIRPGVSKQTVMTFDLFPTLLPLTGGKAPALDGTDLAPVLFRGAALAPRSLFWRMDQQRAVRRGPWKLVVQDRRAPMLFNLDDDLGETNDLAGRRTGTVQELRKALDEWEKEVVPGSKGR
jgi:arylsulfatase A-like enzyme